MIQKSIKLKSLTGINDKTDRSPQYYQYYPRLFHSYFSNIDNEIVNKVSDASYLYYHSILLIDKVIDDGNVEYFPNIIQLQEDTIKVLTSIIGINSSFWNFWQERKKEYFEANQIDKKLMQQPKVSIVEYEILADKKSAMGKVAIDLMSVLSNNENQKMKQHLLESHYYFSVAFQMYDDIQDFKSDLIKNQFNWAVYFFKNEQNLKDFEKDPEIIYKMFYLSGVGQKILRESVGYVQKSINILEALHIDSEWLNVNYSMKQTLNSYLEFTEKYVNDYIELSKNSLQDE